MHGDICRAPEFVDRATVTARLRFSLLHSKTVTLSSQSLEVHGLPIRVLLSGRIGDVARALFRKLRFIQIKMDVECRHWPNEYIFKQQLPPRLTGRRV